MFFLRKGVARSSELPESFPALCSLAQSVELGHYNTHYNRHYQVCGSSALFRPDDYRPAVRFTRSMPSSHAMPES